MVISTNFILKNFIISKIAENKLFLKFSGMGPRKMTVKKLRVDTTSFNSPSHWSQR